jgi:hypothetical protein
MTPVAPTAPFHGVTFDNFTIPEPSSIILVLMGALGVMGVGWMRRRR